ncbi:acyl-CoA thioesterase/bile acid-CoA:amino acid N-acyltransferase family protein [Clostridium uliginosum]|uniref:Acyl-CoA thioester hydrolase/BAAT N-terminal region n=1 Tax=Clostridium uliginosum TaxID=119641 RepID=A0A1I1SPN0_9CLOT|nr:acyl-CoA thioester hydrolase/BAAT C-terminal domain-containing protein [Clostridium uliginosum]SFD45843.1 hypothetical protein SAMN05421842_1527 [Clostridium uliginosum]
MEDQYKISVIPEVALIDEKITIKLSGFNPKERVTIQAETNEYYCINRSCEQKSMDESYAVFEADDNGNIDLSRQAPVEGCYSGINSMGLLEFMKLKNTKNQKKSVNLKDVNIDEGYIITFSVKIKDKVVIKKNHTRMYRSENVKCVDINEDNLVARYFKADDDIPKPGIIVLSGSEGGMEKAQITAGLLASHGYSALALCYFGLESLPSSLEKIPLEYIENAIKWMGKEQTVLSDKICIYGRSKGGELALLAASIFKQIKGVIANTPSSIVWQGLNESNRPSKYSSWSYKGKEIPYLKFNSLAAFKYIIKKKFRQSAQISDIYRSSVNSIKASECTIAVEKINGPILLISGEKDEFWSSKIFCENIIKRLDEFKFKNKREHHDYRGSGHFITLPYQGLREEQNNPEAIIKANEDSWNKAMQFLNENFINK